MDLQNFKELNRLGGISEVQLREEDGQYYVWFEFMGKMEPLTLTRPNPSVEGLPERSWSDLNRALSFVRRHGWTGPVVVCTD